MRSNETINGNAGILLDHIVAGKAPPGVGRPRGFSPRAVVRPLRVKCTNLMEADLDGFLNLVTEDLNMDSARASHDIPKDNLNSV
ncbi:hypothetical protein EVAR_38426_1 [Eumeta japonica]|uniref:Uncharacterized protein n=1 Tax=Eumeta variegata TaxID=151549 RepID=A0A4C1X0F0_EUMVA|nr:hypothetical protein EVAR_38426_1 [Eumeta japonica]